MEPQQGLVGSEAKHCGVQRGKCACLDFSHVQMTFKNSDCLGALQTENWLLLIASCHQKMAEGLASFLRLPEDKLQRRSLASPPILSSFFPSSHPSISLLSLSSSSASSSLLTCLFTTSAAGCRQDENDVAHLADFGSLQRRSSHCGF